MRSQGATDDTFELGMPGRLVKLQEQLELPQRKASSHRCINELLVRHVVKCFEQIMEDCSHHMPVCRGPFAPGRLLPYTAFDTVRVRGPEET